MSGPWEDFQATAVAERPPWEDFSAAPDNRFQLELDQPQYRPSVDVNTTREVPAPMLDSLVQRMLPTMIQTSDMASDVPKVVAASARQALVEGPSNLANASSGRFGYVTDPTGVTKALKPIADKWKEFADSIIPKAPELEPTDNPVREGVRAVAGMVVPAAEIAIGNRVGAAAKLGPVISGALSFGTSSAVHGGDPVEGAAMGAGVGLMGRLLPGREEWEKLARPAMEALGFYKIAREQGASNPEAIAQSALPLAMHVIDSAVGLWRTKPEIAQKIVEAERPSRRMVEQAGAPQMNADQRVGFKEVLAATKDIADTGKAVQEGAAEQVVGNQTAEAPPARAEAPQTPKELPNETQVEEQGQRQGQELQLPVARAVESPPANQPTRPPGADSLGIVKPQGIILDDIANAAGTAYSKAASLAKRLLTSKGDLPEPAFRAKISRDGKIGSQMTQIGFTLKDFDTAAKEAYGGKDRIPASDIQQMDAALKGDPHAVVRPEMQPVIDDMRTQIDALSRRLIDVGAVEGDLVPIVQANMGVYANRSYRVFDDPKWAETVDPAVRNKAKALLRSEYPERTPEQIDGLIENLLYEAKAAEEGPIAMLRQAKLGSKDLSILMRRHTIPEEIRALWGEYTDPRVNYARSVAKMGALIANHQFLTEVRGAGLGRWLHELPVVNNEGQFKTRIAADASKPMHPLNGLYTTPEIKAAFDGVYSNPISSKAFEWYMKANGAVKFAKTVASVMTHVRNTLSNSGFALANSHWRLWNAPDAAKTIAASLKLNNNADWRAYVRELHELGVVGEGIRAGELRDVIRDATRRESPFDTFQPGGKLKRKVLGAATELYRVEDEIWKVYAYQNEYTRYRKAMPGWSDQQVKARAAEIVRNTYPTYSMTPEGVKLLRRFPLVGTFVSFPAEIIRTGYHTLKLASQELSDPSTRTIGAERLAGILAATTLTAGISAWSRHQHGVSRKQDEDLRKFLPPWSQNSQLVHLGQDKKGNFEYIDLSYTDPFQYWRKPIVALMRGENWEDALLQSGLQATEPFVGEEILAGKLADIARNKKGIDGGPLFNPQDDFTVKAQKSLAHVYDALEPGAITSMRRIVAGLKGKTSLYGKSYDPKLEALAVTTGHRLSEVDVRQALSFKARDYAQGRQDAQRILNQTVTRRGTVEEGEIGTAYDRTTASRRRLFDNMRELMHAAIRLGVPKEDVLKIVKGAGLPADEVGRLYRGAFAPTHITPETVKSTFHAVGQEELHHRLEAYRRKLPPPGHQSTAQGQQ